VAATLGHTIQGCLVVSALALGLILGSRVVLALAGERKPSVSRTEVGNVSEYPEGSLAQETRHAEM
jgi:hypothetical protein